MKKAWDDLKSFLTIMLLVLLFVIVIANIFGKRIDENLLILTTNLITSVFTYYFAKKDKGDDKNG
jgi:hypothetical protein